MSEIQLRPAHGDTTAAARIIAHHVEPTPLREEKAFSELLNADVFVKSEFLNPVRSFKIRGALNLAHALANSNRVSRVITVSTGNHGAAMAFACQKYDLSTHRWRACQLRSEQTQADPSIWWGVRNDWP